MVGGSGNLGMYCPKRLVFPLFGRGGGTQLFADISKHLGEWELRYVWTQTVSFSIESRLGTVDMQYNLYEAAGRNTGITSIVHNPGQVLPVFYQNLPVFAILVQILVNTSIPISSRIFQYLQYQKILVIAKKMYCRYWKILGNTGYTSIADTGRFWKILVIPVLQMLENTGYTYQYYRYWKILVILVLQILEDQRRSCGMYL